ncbi:hypothetical protein ABW20_dc0101979 [Dactylellina cionopaga]|nr:hypothetical protein ABW20_dc0101979 [Dactylellina cionopaga]
MAPDRIDATSIQLHVGQTQGRLNLAKCSEMLRNFPGVVGGLSTMATKDCDLKAQLPAKAVCSGSRAGQTGVCVLRVHNNTPAGPYGGSIAFIQSSSTVSCEQKVKKARRFETLAIL